MKYSTGHIKPSILKTTNLTNSRERGSNQLSFIAKYIVLKKVLVHVVDNLYLWFLFEYLLFKELTFSIAPVWVNPEVRKNAYCFMQWSYLSCTADHLIFHHSFPVWPRRSVCKFFVPHSNKYSVYYYDDCACAYIKGNRRACRSTYIPVLQLYCNHTLE